ncbi:hypothetical protein EVG20_g2338 [Dentipellis fragilis]|uniref:Uncharacterized protein n=1 Tax=Dentipellis fragilis TaxID=205917 RepID=A0A4Y9ZA33_9AGAM|nr:hypothetical protein EVG20_g2338 [Dentipellis fragilis]
MVVIPRPSPSSSTATVKSKPGLKQSATTTHQFYDPEGNKENIDPNGTSALTSQTQRDTRKDSAAMDESAFSTYFTNAFSFADNVATEAIAARTTKSSEAGFFDAFGMCDAADATPDVGMQGLFNDDLWSYSNTCAREPADIPLADASDTYGCSHIGAFTF